MKIRSNHRINVLLSSATFWLCACQGELAVVENLDDNTSDLSAGQDGEDDAAQGEPDDVGEPRDAECGCASSPSLQALGCHFGEVPFVENDIVQTTRDGSVVAFSVCDANFFNCKVIRWTAAGEEYQIGAGLLLGLNAAGDRVLVAGDGTTQGAELIDASGERFDTGLQMLGGAGALSASGEVVVAQKNVDDARYLARWSGGEVELLQDMGAGFGRAYITPDATAVVGTAEWNSDSTYRWTQSGGFTSPLPGLLDGKNLSATSISSDGSVIAGISLPHGISFRWTEALGLQELTFASWRSGTLLSLDGSVLAGSRGDEDPDTTQAFRWTQAGGVQDLTPGIATSLIDMSDDGSVIIATSPYDPDVDEPLQTYVWDEANGTRELSEVLDAQGVDRSGWSFGMARVISGDGKVLLGLGTCGGSPTLYRVEL